MSKPEEVEALFKETAAAFKDPVNILVNNAGITKDGTRYIQNGWCSGIRDVAIVYLPQFQHVANILRCLVPLKVYLSEVYPPIFTIGLLYSAKLIGPGFGSPAPAFSCFLSHIPPLCIRVLPPSV